MNDFGPKRPMSESAETAPTDTAKAKRGRPKKKPDYDRENVRKKACTRLTCSRICDILGQTGPDSGATGDRGSCCSNNHTPLRGEQQATI